MADEIVMEEKGDVEVRCNRCHVPGWLRYEVIVEVKDFTKKEIVCKKCEDVNEVSSKTD